LPAFLDEDFQVGGYVYMYMYDIVTFDIKLVISIYSVGDLT